MTVELVNKINDYLSNNPRSLSRQSSRNKFARALADFISYWSYHEMEMFVNEMRGLNLSKVDDRQTFFAFFENAFGGAST